jgi:hypothetical protein
MKLPVALRLLQPQGCASPHRACAEIASSMNSPPPKRAFPLLTVVREYPDGAARSLRSLRNRRRARSALVAGQTSLRRVAELPGQAGCASDRRGYLAGRAVPARLADLANLADVARHTHGRSRLALFGFGLGRVGPASRGCHGASGEQQDKGQKAHMIPSRLESASGADETELGLTTCADARRFPALGTTLCARPDGPGTSGRSECATSRGARGRFNPAA